jgi:hypothetical protein
LISDKIKHTKQSQKAQDIISTQKNKALNKKKALKSTGVYESTIVKKNIKITGVLIQQHQTTRRRTSH